MPSPRVGSFFLPLVSRFYFFHDFFCVWASAVTLLGNGNLSLKGDHLIFIVAHRLTFESIYFNYLHIILMKTLISFGKWVAWKPKRGTSNEKAHFIQLQPTCCYSFSLLCCRRSAPQRCLQQQYCYSFRRMKRWQRWFFVTTPAMATKPPLNVIYAILLENALTSRTRANPILTSTI